MAEHVSTVSDYSRLSQDGVKTCCIDPHLFSERKETLIQNPTHVNSQHNYLKACVNALLYQDGTTRPMTHRTLKLLEESKSKLDEGDASFIKGIRRYQHRHRCFPFFSEAEEKGCTHPFLYYFLGECYMSDYRGVSKDISKAADYYSMSVGGMSMTWVPDYYYSYSG